MLRAVQFIHSKRILHRDIKLNNWVIRADNTCLCGINIVLIDFGTHTVLVEKKMLNYLS